MRGKFNGMKEKSYIHLIEKTRKGFLYQDKYALLKFIEKLLSDEKLAEFYVDYPNGSRKSIDIFLKSAQSEEVYEIKTGEIFKKDKNKLLGKELVDFYYFVDNGKIKKYLVVTDPIPSEMSLNYTFIKAINEKKRNTHKLAGKSLGSIKKELWKKWNFHTNGIKFDNFVEFLKSFDIQIKPENEFGPNSNSDIDSIILGKINEVNNKFESKNKTFCNEWFDDSNIIKDELLYEIVECAGTGKNIIFDLIKTISHGYARKSIVSQKDVNAIDLKKEDSKYESELMNILNNTSSSSIVEDNSITDSGEGSLIKE